MPGRRQRRWRLGRPPAQHQGNPQGTVQAILSITAPIFLLIALGYAAGRRGLFSKPDLRVLGQFVLRFALPALLFKTLATRPLEELLDASYLSAAALGSLAVFGGAWVWQRKVAQRPVQASALRAMGSSFPNSGYIGFPIVTQLVGPVAGVALALNMLVENLLLLPLWLVLMEAGGSSGRPWQRVLWDVLRDVVRNPLVLAIAAGIAVAATGWALPAPLWRSIELLAQATSAVALFIIGGSLVGLSTRGLIPDIASVAFAKLVLHPLAVYATLWLLPPLSEPLRVAVVTFAAMPMLGIFPLLAQRYGLEGPAAAALLGTTVASFFSISALLWLLTSGHLPWP